MTKQVVARATAAPFVHDLRCNKFEILEWLQKVQQRRIWKFTSELLSLLLMLCSNEVRWWAWSPDRAESLIALLLYKIRNNFPFTFRFVNGEERKRRLQECCASFYVRTALFLQREHAAEYIESSCFYVGCMAWIIVKLYKRWTTSVVRLFNSKTWCNTDQQKY